MSTHNDISSLIHDRALISVSLVLRFTAALKQRQPRRKELYLE